jgi:hypothetical protein
MEDYLICKVCYARPNQAESEYYYCNNCSKMNLECFICIHMYPTGYDSQHQYTYINKCEKCKSTDCLYRYNQ